MEAESEEETSQSSLLNRINRPQNSNVREHHRKTTDSSTEREPLITADPCDCSFHQQQQRSKSSKRNRRRKSLHRHSETNPPSKGAENIDRRTPTGHLQDYSTFHATTILDLQQQVLDDITSPLTHAHVSPDTVSLPAENSVVYYGTVDPSPPAIDRSVRRTMSEPDVSGPRRLNMYGLVPTGRHVGFRRVRAHSRYSRGAGSHRGTSSNARSPDQVASFSLCTATRHEKSLLACIALTNLCDMMCLSVMAPFFPSEAESKGVNQTLAGWIFGVFALTQFIFAPVCGKLITYLSPQFLFLAGQFLAGGCYILFGFLEYVDSSPEDYTVYFSLCCLLRIVTAIGCCATMTATFTISAQQFPDNIATVFGLMETSTGLGLSLGPALGGVLYDAGGFKLPFITLGSFMVLMVPVNYCMLPVIRNDPQLSAPASVFTLLRVTAILVTCGCVFLGAVVWSALDPTLQPHLALVEGYNLSSSVIGLIFLLMSAMYGIFCPVFGMLCDKIKDVSLMLSFGFLLTGVGVMLLGPNPHLGFPAEYNVLWLNLVALVILGIALALAVVPTFDKILDAADEAGIEDSLEMYGVVAGMWGSFYALGDFVGPSIGGFLVERFTFHWTMAYLGYLCWLMAIVCLLLYIYEHIVGPTQVMSCPCVGRRRKFSKLDTTVIPSSNGHVPYFAGNTYGYTTAEGDNSTTTNRLQVPISWQQQTIANNNISQSLDSLRTAMSLNNTISVSSDFRTLHSLSRNSSHDSNSMSSSYTSCDSTETDNDCQAGVNSTTGSYYYDTVSAEGNNIDAVQQPLLFKTL